MKTDDGYFRGFPALWNLVALYLYAAQLGQTAAAVVVALLVLLTFAPIHVVHPLRVTDYGRWAAALALVWGASTLALLFPDLHSLARLALFVTSAATAVLLVGMGLLRSLRGSSVSGAR
jgi:phosphatidylcholine synthase